MADNLRTADLTPSNSTGLKSTKRVRLDDFNQPSDEATLEARKICDAYGLNTQEYCRQGLEHPFIGYIAPALREKNHRIAALEKQVADAKQ